VNAPPGARLREGAQALGLALTDSQVTMLENYLALMHKWNKVYNISGVQDPAQMLAHHLFDSLAIIGPLRRKTGGTAARLLDVGSGAGLPGVVIAICCEEIQVDCVDAVAKKAAFVQQAAAALQLPNIRALHARVENLAGPYEVIASRAFAALPDFVSWSRQALSSEGVWLAMKGKPPAGEIAELPPFAHVFHVEQLDVPGLAAQRCIVWIKPAQPVP